MASLPFLMNGKISPTFLTRFGGLSAYVQKRRFFPSRFKGRKGRLYLAFLLPEPPETAVFCYEKRDGMKRFFLMVALLLCACSSNAFLDYYEQEDDAPTTVKLTDRDVVIIETSRFDAKIESLLKRGYVIVGRASFKNKWEPRYLAVEAAVKYGACVVVTTSDAVETVTKTYNTAVPQANVGFYGGNVGGRNFRGTSVGLSVQNVTNAYSYAVLEQKAVFLAKTEDAR